jgi:hypothetical protein
MKIESSRAMKMSASKDRGKDFLILRRPERAVSKDEETLRRDLPRPRASRRLLRRLLSMRAKLRGTGDVRL